MFTGGMLLCLVCSFMLVSPWFRSLSEFWWTSIVVMTRNFTVVLPMTFDTWQRYVPKSSRSAWGSEKNIFSVKVAGAWASLIKYLSPFTSDIEPSSNNVWQVTFGSGCAIIYLSTQKYSCASWMYTMLLLLTFFGWPAKLTCMKLFISIMVQKVCT